MTIAYMGSKHAPMVLSDREEIVIDILRGGEMYGLDIVDRSGGMLQRGTVYVTLSGMEERGLIKGESEPAKPGCLPRTVYRVTDDGLQVFYRRHTHIPVAIAVSA